MLFERELGEGYPFHYRKGPSHKDGLLVCTHYYTFRTRKNRRYVVEAEQYQHHVYVLKYYPLALKASPNRFKLLVNDGDAFRILTTCTQIFLDICRRDPLASAGFVGEALPGESWVATKRFRVYLKMVTAFVGPTRFLHHPLPPSARTFWNAGPTRSRTSRIKWSSCFGNCTSCRKHWNHLSTMSWVRMMKAEILSYRIPQKFNFSAKTSVPSLLHPVCYSCVELRTS